MSVFKRGKYWVVQFNYNNKTYSKSSRSTRKRDALELERQMRQQLVDTQVLGKLEHIRLYDACDELLAVSQQSGAYGSLVTATNRFKTYFDNRYLGDISNRDLLRWVEYERKRGIQDITIRLWSRQFNKVCRNAKRLGYYTPDYEWGEWHVKEKPIRYLTDSEEQTILRELDPSRIKSTTHRAARQAARDLFIVMVDAGFRISEASTLQWSQIDFENGFIHLYRSKVSNEDFVPMTRRLRITLENRRKAVAGDYVFPGRFGGHKTPQNNRALEAAFERAGVDDVSSHNLRKTFATRLLSRGAAITDVQHLLGHSSVKTTEKTYAAFVRNERFKQTIDLLDEDTRPELTVVK
jgi:integrase